MSDEKPVIYHNPLCSKSRETLDLLKQHDADPEIVEYLEDPPTPEELRSIVKMLGISARDLLRTTESVYEDAGLDDDTLDDEEIIDTICEFPALLQRPIVVVGNKAVIGRPPSKVLDIIA
ncbi:MAG: arsenate reductase (glutaredoxin) [Pseudomonadota bacterium]